MLDQITRVLIPLIMAYSRQILRGERRWELFFLHSSCHSPSLCLSRHTSHFFSQTTKEELRLPINGSSIRPVLGGQLGKSVCQSCCSAVSGPEVWRCGWSLVVLEWEWRVQSWVCSSVYRLKPTCTCAHWTGHPAVHLFFVKFKAKQ